MALSVWLAVALVLSNLAVVPAGVLAYWRGYVVELTILVLSFTISTAFHMCQVGWFCFGLELHGLQLGDHFMVYWALVWFSLYWVGAAERLRMALTIAAMGVSLPVIATFIGTWIPGAFVVGVTIVLALIVLAIALKLYGGPPVNWKAFAAALVLLGVGVFLHVMGGDFGSENWKYPIAHSLWHMFAYFALYFILAIPFKDLSKGHAWYSVSDHARLAPTMGLRRFSSRKSPPPPSTDDRRRRPRVLSTKLKRGAVASSSSKAEEGKRPPPRRSKRKRSIQVVISTHLDEDTPIFV